MSHSGYVHVLVEKIIGESDSAFLCRIDGEEMWIPKSQITDPEIYERGDEDVTVSMTQWIADKKGIEGID